jgi:hypothetical protein
LSEIAFEFAHFIFQVGDDCFLIDDLLFVGIFDVIFVLLFLLEGN